MLELSMYERTEREETESSCGHRSLTTLWRKVPRKKSVWFSEGKGPNPLAHVRNSGSGRMTIFVRSCKRELLNVQR